VEIMLGAEGQCLMMDATLGLVNPLLINCILSGNSAGSGGAMLNRGFSELENPNQGTSSPILINCVLSGNFAHATGGAMYNFGVFSHPNLTNCILWNNQATNNGPVFF
jgi:hypothetical protein